MTGENPIGGAHHVPDPQDDGSCADMAAQTAACGVPAVPRGDHRLVRFTAAARAFRGDVCGGSRPRLSCECPPSVGPLLKNDKRDLSRAA